jgi:hypothetical protein
MVRKVEEVLIAVYGGHAMQTYSITKESGLEGQLLESGLGHLMLTPTLSLRLINHKPEDQCTKERANTYIHNQQKGGSRCNKK